MASTQTTFSAKDVMKLREKTGLGMMDCKEALTKTGGDMKAAEEWLREKLKGKMDTRTERATAQGRIGIAIRGPEAAIVEVQTETDFTAKNEKFVTMVHDVAHAALKLSAGPLAKPTPEMTKRIDDLRITTGENIVFARAERLSAAPGSGGFGSYIHHDHKRGAVIQVETAPGLTVDPELLSGICMHIVAHVPPPVAVDEAGVPKDALDRVRAEGMSEARESGKPESIQQKIAEGKVRKFLEEHTLLNQIYVKDPAGKQRVKDALPRGVTIRRFIRYVLGGA
jgi:elongation factor Ts